jgi:tetratricopeptide (TPR) repeat protein
MPSPLAARGRRQAKIWGVAIAAVLVAGVSGALGFASQSKTVVVNAEADDTVAELVNLARAAGARAYYVYPPPDDTSFRTAFQRIVELEEIGGSYEKEAMEQAAELRMEFASTLERLGDWYFAEPAGKQFAVEYYIQALVFNPDSARKERVALTAGELAEVRRKAREGDYSKAELVALAILPELQVAAESDEQAAVETEPAEEKQKALRKALRRKRKALIDQRAEVEQALVAVGEPVSPEPPVATDQKAAAAAQDDTSAAQADSVESSDGPRASRPAKSAQAKADRGRLRELLAEAKEARRKGDNSRAMTLFNRVVDADNDNATALMGLSDIYFDRGDFSSAVRFAERAVKSAPRNASYQLRLGDAYYKRLQYTEARAAYTRAKQLGHDGAERKLEKIRQQLGG